MSTRDFKQALASALALEVLAVGALVAWVVTHPVAREPKAVALTIEAIQEPEVPKPPEPERPKPPAPLPPKPVPPTVTAAPPPPTPAPAATPPVAVLEPAPSPAATLPLAAPPPPKPVAAPPPGPVSPTADYVDKVRAAVQAAFVYPLAAKAMEFKGRARVGFKLRDGHASDAHLVVRSGLGIGDRAALDAVQNASYPAPTAELRGVELSCEIWVELR